MLIVKRSLQKLANVFGYRIIRASKTKITENSFPKDIENEFLEIYEKCQVYTMTSMERMYALYQGTKYVVNAKIPGDFVECGVWRGGSSMLMALTLLKCKDVSRKIFLYDTFEGMSKPIEKDIQIVDGKPALETWQKEHMAFSSFNETKTNMLSVGYPENNITFVKGKVENTIPSMMPFKISLLRLDTDWYETTSHELRHLFPLLSNKGVIIIDDYGHWSGAKEATDKYFFENKTPILLNRIDYTGRLGIKV